MMNRTVKRDLNGILILMLLVVIITAVAFVGMIYNTESNEALRVACAPWYDIFGISHPWHPPLKCIPY